MLKKIAVADLRLGMHLHALEGNWLANPLWRSRFVLERQADLDRLHASGIADCWIDSAKGGDVPSPDSCPDTPTSIDVPQAAPTTSSLPSLAPLSVIAKPKRTSMSEELARASVLLAESRQAVESLFGQARLGEAIDAEHCAPLVNEITESMARNPGALIGLLRLKKHDDYSYLHSVAVCALMVSLARQLGFSDADARNAGFAGLLHDMGKAVMPLGILNKPGKLTPAEYQVMKKHPERGHQLLSQSTGVPLAALDVCLHHHERPDGNGYPHGLAGDALSQIARMGAICDVYDAITSDRPYKSGWDPAESIARMAEWTQSGQFDKPVFAAFVKSLGMYPAGSLVRLQSGRLAVVVEQNEAALNKPRVRVFFSTRSQLPLPREVIDIGAPGCSDRIVGRESNRDWKFANLGDLWIDG